MDSIDDGAPPPAELVLSWHCERWHALPEAGGLMDQDARTVYRMAVLANIHNAVEHMRNLQGEQIHYLSDSERTILKFLVDSGLIFNG